MLPPRADERSIRAHLALSPAERLRRLEDEARIMRTLWNAQARARRRVPPPLRERQIRVVRGPTVEERLEAAAARHAKVAALVARWREAGLIA
jgi:hypothetical protein